jgi:GNAT superfamily N-acetyltransferase
MGLMSQRRCAASDRQLWEPLWKGYLDFCGKHISDETIEFTWRRVSECRQIRGFLAIDHTGVALGLFHYFFHPSTSSIRGNCYIQDLLVLPSSRRQSLGRQLIAAVVESAKEKQAAVVYWQTEEFNGAARRLYERVAKRSVYSLPN